jgi:hypothetical protein
MPAKPKIIMAHVEGSGTAATAIIKGLLVVVPPKELLLHSESEPAWPSAKQLPAVPLY